MISTLGAHAEGFSCTAAGIGQVFIVRQWHFRQKEKNSNYNNHLPPNCAKRHLSNNWKEILVWNRFKEKKKVWKTRRPKKVAVITRGGRKAGFHCTTLVSVLIGVKNWLSHSYWWEKMALLGQLCRWACLRLCKSFFCSLKNLSRLKPRKIVV